MENLEKLADLFKALSDPTRLKIVKILSQHKRPKCVNALTKVLDISQSAVSQHLRILKQAEVVKGERRGNFVHYTLNEIHLDSIRNRLHETDGNDFLIVCNDALFSFGSNFWNQQTRIKVLEEHLSNLQGKTSEIESLIQKLKKENS